MNKYLPYIIIVLLVVLIIQGFLNGGSNIPEDYVEDKIELHDLKQSYDNSTNANTQLQLQLNNVQNEMLKKDTVISTYNKFQLDSFFTNILKR